jgi:DNA-directed RNA polymerase specialized sigma24 family protein
VLDEREAGGGVDRLLLPFLSEGDEMASERLLAQLMTGHAEPVVEKVIRSKLRVSLKPSDGSHLNQDALEISSDAQAQVLNQLRAIKDAPERKVILNFRSYVAVITHNACSEYLRRKYPERSRLKNRLRYLLTHQPTFALWEDEEEGELLCGLAAWREQKRGASSNEWLQQLRADTQFWMNGMPRSMAGRESAPTAQAVAAIFEYAGGAVELDVLVSAIADIYGIKDQTSYQEDEEDAAEDAIEQLPDERADVAAEMEQRIYLQTLWAEVCQLPPRQRAALLLNLRDGQGRGLIALFPLLRIASMREIGVALGVGRDEFARLWNELPLEDASIASLLGVTRQQVINLRKCARERLARRMKGF